MFCVTVCKCPEKASLWEEGVNVDETTRRENLAGEEAQAAQSEKQSGKAGDWLHYRAAVCIAGWLPIGEFNNISLRIQNWNVSNVIAFKEQANTLGGYQVFLVTPK